jgi:hypothetical protein
MLANDFDLTGKVSLLMAKRIFKLLFPPRFTSLRVPVPDGANCRIRSKNRLAPPTFGMLNFN